MNKLPRSVQTGILILVWSLAVIWLYSPERIRAFEHSFTGTLLLSVAYGTDLAQQN